VTDGRWISLSEVFEGHEDEAADYLASRRDRMQKRGQIECDQCDFTTDWSPALTMHKQVKHEGGPVHEATVNPPPKPRTRPGRAPATFAEKAVAEGGEGWAGSFGPAGIPAAHLVLDEAKALHDLKRDGYGTDEDPLANYHAVAEFGIAPSAYVIQRIGEKLNRLKAALGRDSGSVDVEEELRDITLCGAIATVLYREENA
jgi:hypothetical protein